MNEASSARLSLARTIAALYAARTGVLMIVVGGSTAHGWADRYSDLDMVVYWDTIDAGWLASPPLTALNGERFTYASGDRESRIEQYQVGALKVDVAHITLAAWEELVADVLERHELAPARQKALAGFLDAVPLAGTELWQRWVDRIARYPDELALAMVRAHLFFLPWWAPRRLALERGDLFGYYDVVCHLIRNLLAVLAGLNRRYYSAGPEPKWTGRFVESLALKPANTFERITAALATPNAETLAALYRLIEEVLTLIEQHLPAVDTSRARWVLSVPNRPYPPTE